MKVTAVAASLLLAGSAAADYTKSKPFKLVVQSDNADLNGKEISACHSGAAIESLCVSDKGAKLYHEYSKDDKAPVQGSTAPGNVMFDLPSGSDQTVPSPMTFSYDASTNVVSTLFEPAQQGTGVSVIFDKRGQLAVVSHLDDSVSPPAYDSKGHALYNWYVCDTFNLAYTYTSLAWVVGGGKPHNPSCVKVDVKRKYI